MFKKSRRSSDKLEVKKSFTIGDALQLSNNFVE